MEPQFQTSFVPKKINEPKPVNQRVSGGGGSRLLTIISLIVFLGSLASIGGAYLYRASLEANVAEYKESLELARRAFQPELLSEIREIDRRMKSATKILENHIAVSPIFKLLGELTLPTIRYSDFSYEVKGENKNLVEVQLSGEAQGYTFIALQSEIFDNNEEIKNPIFSNLSLDQDGNVDFSLTFNVNRNFVLYDSLVERGELQMFGGFDDFVPTPLPEEQIELFENNNPQI